MSDELYLRAVSFLARREHSRAELRRKLAAYSEDMAEVDAVIERLRAGRLQSDERFCESLMTAKAKRYGSLRLADELRRKGVDAEMAAHHLPTAEDELQHALAVLRKKFGTPEPSLAMKQKYYRFLAYRGFDGDTAQRALRQWQDGEE